VDLGGGTPGLSHDHFAHTSFLTIINQDGDNGALNRITTITKFHKVSLFVLCFLAHILYFSMGGFDMEPEQHQTNICGLDTNYSDGES